MLLAGQLLQARRILRTPPKKLPDPFLAGGGFWSLSLATLLPDSLEKNSLWNLTSMFRWVSVFCGYQQPDLLLWEILKEFLFAGWTSPTDWERKATFLFQFGHSWDLFVAAAVGLCFGNCLYVSWYSYGKSEFDKLFKYCLAPIFFGICIS